MATSGRKKQAGPADVKWGIGALTVEITSFMVDSGPRREQWKGGLILGEV